MNEEVGSCSVCADQKVTLMADSWSKHGIRDVDNAFKHRLFHSDCSKCVTTSPDSIPLCGRCQHLQLWHLTTCSSAFSDERDGELVLSIDPFSEDSPSCQLCRFIAEILLEHCRLSGNTVDNMRNGRFSLGLPKTPGSPFRIGPFSKHVHIQLISTDMESSYGTQAPTKPVVGDFVDWSLVRRWTTKCPTCELDQDGNHVNGHEALPHLSDELEDVRVVDVSQRCIVKLPPNAKYVALSYVWGTEPAGQFQALKENIGYLETPGSLNNVKLPRSITDTITACQKLGQRYCWIDRICIIQDDDYEQKLVQLDQMGVIYREATFTIVALAGSGATFGLPGVTLPRHQRQRTLDLHGVQLVESVPSIQICLQQSPWNTRAWTYQEGETASKILYFTDYGVYYRCRHENKLRVKSEGPAEVASLFTNDGNYLDRIESYTKRNMTYPSDILNAFAGILHGMYGEDTFYGLPVGAFDRAILWDASEYTHPRRKYDTNDANHIFPTWSWSSAYGPIYFKGASTRGCSLAYWAASSYLLHEDAFKISVFKPNEEDEKLFYDRSPKLESQIPGALAWLNGCIRTTTPEYLQMDTYMKYFERLYAQWPTHALYWHEAFKEYSHEQLFSDQDLQLARSVGRLLVHTQTASFHIEWVPENLHDPKSTNPGRNCFLIRSQDGTIAGAIYVTEHWATSYKPPNGPTQAQFIALSTAQYPVTALMADLLGNLSPNINLSQLYGCPCTRGLDVSNEHIPSCPTHPNFSESLPHHPRRQNPRRFGSNASDHIRAYVDHIGGLSYLDPAGTLLHQWDDPPSLNVMMLGSLNPDPRIACRVAIGQIYLKRWVKAKPVFKTTVLE